MAEVVAKYLAEEELRSALEFSKKKNSFKLKLVLSSVPEDIMHALKSCTNETTSSFGGSRAVKVRIMSADLLSEETVANLISMTETFDFWVEQAITESDQHLRDLGNAFYQDYAG